LTWSLVDEQEAAVFWCNVHKVAFRKDAMAPPNDNTQTCDFDEYVFTLRAAPRRATRKIKIAASCLNAPLSLLESIFCLPASSAAAERVCRRFDSTYASHSHRTRLIQPCELSSFSWLVTSLDNLYSLEYETSSQ